MAPEFVFKRLARLTERQFQILQLRCKKMTYEQIASELGIAKSSVSTQMIRIFKKLHLDEYGEKDRLEILHQTYCPALAEMSLPSDDDPVETGRDDEDENREVNLQAIQKMVADDEAALILWQPRLPAVIPEPTPPQTGRGKWILAGILIGIVLFGGFLIAVLSTGIGDKIFTQEVPVTRIVEEIVINTTTEIVTVETEVEVPRVVTEATVIVIEITSVPEPSIVPPAPDAAQVKLAANSTATQIAATIYANLTTEANTITETLSTPTPPLSETLEATPNPNVFYEYHFDDDIAEDWIPAAGTWTVDTTQATYICVGGNDARASTGDMEWTDYIVSAKAMSFSSNVNIGVTGRVNADGRLYLASINGSNAVLWRRRTNGDYVFLTQAPYVANNNTWYEVGLEFIGADITMYINNTPIVTTRDAALSSGSIGLRCRRAQTEFDDVIIESR